VFERSELSEAPAELIERSEKRIVSVLARWEPERRVGANVSGLEIKWGFPSSGLRRTKRGSSGLKQEGKGENTCAKQKYTPVSRARGTTRI
jgi:hypothetical protein